MTAFFGYDIPAEHRNRFIVFEGGEGAGKSAQLLRLAKRLAASGMDVVTTREPGGSQNAEDLRSFIFKHEGFDWLEEAALFNAARRNHLRNTVLPALARGALVLCDRYVGSTIAYQGYALIDGELDYYSETAVARREAMWSLHRVVCAGIVPALTIVLDVDPEIGIRRALGRGGDEVNRFDLASLIFHERVRTGFLELNKEITDFVSARDHQGRPLVRDSLGQGRTSVIDTTHMSLDEVSEVVTSMVLTTIAAQPAAPTIVADEQPAP